MENQNIISDNIKSLRIYLGLTPPQFAKRIGVSVALVNKVEAGTVPPSAGLIDKIVKRTGVSIGRLAVQDFKPEV